MFYRQSVLFTGKMLKSLLECKLNTNFLIIQDDVEVGGQDLFVSLLHNYAGIKTVNKINLLCYENPPKFYIHNSEYEKITCYNFFSNLSGWNDYLLESQNTTNVKSDLSSFICDDYSKTIFFIDSLSYLVSYHGFYSAYRNLRDLKLKAEMVVCLVHGDLLGIEQLEELFSLSPVILKLRSVINCNVLGELRNCKVKLIDIVYKKPGGKVVNQKEVYTVKDDFKVFSEIYSDKKSVLKSDDSISDMTNLTTFKLSINMSESEKQAKNDLVLPYLRTASNNVEAGKIIYNVDEEDDPDDDLDI